MLPNHGTRLLNLRATSACGAGGGKVKPSSPSCHAVTLHPACMSHHCRPREAPASGMVHYNIVCIALRSSMRWQRAAVHISVVYLPFGGGVSNEGAP